MLGFHQMKPEGKKETKKKSRRREKEGIK